MSIGEIILQYIAIVVLVALSALFSGLTLGLLGLDTNQLKVRKRSCSAAAPCCTAQANAVPPPASYRPHRPCADRA